MFIYFKLLAINEKVFHYYNEPHIYNLERQMRQTFKKQRKPKNRFSTNIVGKFIIGHQFQVKLRLQISRTKNVDPTTIDGELIPNGKRTEVLFRLSPSSFYIEFFVSIVLGLLGLYKFFENKEMIVLLMAIVLLFLVPYLLLALIDYEKRKLKEEFINTFNLLPKDL